MKTLPLIVTIISAHSLLDAAETSNLPADQVAFFEKNIRPVLVESCYKCHSEESQKVKGGLTLDTAAGLRLGGESGHAGVTPGDLSASSIYEAMTWQNEDMQMPPKQKLPDQVLANFKTWIEMGAPDPREKKALASSTAGRRVIDIDSGRQHWAFQKPTDPPIPTVQNTAWPRTTLDRHLLASMEKAGLQPNPDADRATLIRRIAFDLTGLPPTPDEVKAFIADQSPDALRRIIDQYLDSPRFGERWARHWLDVARYGESSGKEVNIPYPNAWRYRDYVIEAFNDDKPYDQFIREQIAGDLMKYEDKRDQAEKIVATGFLAIGAKGHNNRDRRQFTLDMVDEQIDAVSQSMLGLTLACARCHDHKFDPVTQRDYYALAGIFLSSDTLYGTHQQLQNNNPSTLIELDRDAGLPSALAKISPAEVAQLKQQLEAAKTNADEMQREVFGQRRADPAAAQGNVAGALRVRAARDRMATVEADFDLFYPDGTPRTLAMGVLDRSSPVNSPILIRGDISQPGEVVPRGLVEVLCAKGEPLNISQGSGRLDLAWFIASKDNPLTARVMVNRIWLHLMGQGIVTTPDNFGVMGLKPTHPELLDHLAVSFMENGWSVKQLIRQILMSRAYQISATYNAKNYAADPENKTHWRSDQRRLDAEAVRDAMLSVAGKLDFYPTDGSPVARISEGRQGLFQLAREVASNPSVNRSIYLPIVRDQIPEVLSVFDFPDASLVNGQRETTNVPSQSLFLLNNPEAIAIADAFAKRVAATEGDPMDKLAYAYTLAFSRAPTAEELTAIRTFWMRFPDQVTGGKSNKESRDQGQFAALSAFCQSLFASAEFRYLN